MYKGIKRTPNKTEKRKIVSKFQLLQKEQVEVNGIITEQLVFKTKEYKRDKNLKWKDFEVANLIAAGINPQSLPTTILPADIDKLSAKAAETESKLDMYEIINEIEREENEPATEQTK